MKNVSKWMLGAAVAVGALGLGAATPAKAEQFGIYVGVRGPAAYVPPCPGPGYAWVAGYYANGYWVPGRWNFVGVRIGGRNDYYRYHRDFDRDRDRDRRDFDRGRDRDRDHYRDRR